MIWRYIPPFSAPGAIQMAVDSWLFHQCRQGLHPPALRFYTWFPATLSLGYFQKRWPEHWSHVMWQGRPLTLVRRPSGGRGVLHHGDLTYSIVNLMEGYSRKDAYFYLCQFLIEGWRRLGLALQFGAAQRGYHQESNCFRLATGADLVCNNGHKFIGSAQLWRGSTVLQHGSVSLDPDVALQRQVFGAGHVQATELPPNIRNLDLSTIIVRLKQAAMDQLGIELNLLPITAQEWEQITTYLDSALI